MDSQFQGLSRRELQALCKLYKIPANITNVAMADALAALETVQGLDELMNESQSPLLKIHQTPALEQSGRTRVQGSCRRKNPETTQTKEVYGTRRSVRLLAKTMADLSLVKNAADANATDDISHGADSQTMMMAEVGLQRNLSESMEKEGIHIAQIKEKENNAADYGAETDATLDNIPSDLDLNQKTCGLDDNISSDLDLNQKTCGLDDNIPAANDANLGTIDESGDMVVDANCDTDSCPEDAISSENFDIIHQEFETKEEAQDVVCLPQNQIECAKPGEEITTEAKDSFAPHCFGNGEEVVQAMTTGMLQQEVEGTTVDPYQFPRPDKNDNQTTFQVSDTIDDDNDAPLHITKEADQKAYEEMSMRQIKKKLKELALTKNNKTQDKQQKHMDKARTALQPLPDNCVRAQENEK